MVVTAIAHTPRGARRTCAPAGEAGLLHEAQVLRVDVEREEARARLPGRVQHGHVAREGPRPPRVPLCRHPQLFRRDAALRVLVEDGLELALDGLETDRHRGAAAAALLELRDNRRL